MADNYLSLFKGNNRVNYDVVGNAESYASLYLPTKG